MRVLIVDDHRPMRKGIARLVLQDWPDADIYEAPSLDVALACGAAVPLDVITLDLSLPDAQGTAGAERLLQALPAVPVLVLSRPAEAAHAARLMRLGARGYLPKERAPEELCAALRRLTEGGEYLASADPGGP